AGEERDREPVLFRATDGERRVAARGERGGMRLITVGLHPVRQTGARDAAATAALAALVGGAALVAAAGRTSCRAGGGRAIAGLGHFAVAAGGASRGPAAHSGAHVAGEAR